MANVEWLCVFLLCATGMAVADDGSGSARPNILLVVADDLGWGDVGWHGGRFQTRVLDKLVREGVELDRHYAQPVCSPTRTALLSGRWTSRFGPHALAPTNRRVFPPGTVTLASALREAGYSTYLAGKWHLGSRPEWGPNHYGFDHSYGTLNGAIDPWTHQYRPGPYIDTWHRDGVSLREDGNATELVAAQVCEWIQHAPKPWFIYVPFHAVHIPIDTPEEYKQLYADTAFDSDPVRNESLRRFGAFVTQLDSKVGTFVNALEQTGQRADTLIAFTSDNGGLAGGGNPYVGKVEATPALSTNAPLRGYKDELYEGGIRVPAFVNWPGKLQPRKVTAAMHVADWMPTFTSLARCPGLQDLAFDGLNQWAALNGQTTGSESRTIYIPHSTGSVVIRDGWKLISRTKGATELFDVAHDPAEKMNLAERQVEKLSELQELLTTLRAADQKTIPADLVNIPN